MLRFPFLVCLTLAALALPLLLVNGDPKALQPLWEDLVSTDATRAYRAIWALARSSDAAAFLGERLQPVTPADPKRVQQLLAELGSDKFIVRERASKELRTIREQIESLLRDGLAQNKLPLESKRRLEAILPPPGELYANREQLPQLRAVEALELSGSEPALKLLQRLAQGASGARLTQHARAAAARLAARPKAAAAQASPKADLYNDPLPKGASLRLGTLRFRNIQRAVFAPDGKSLVGSGFDQFHLIDPLTGAQRAGFPKRDVDDCISLVFSPDRKLLAASMENGLAVMLWTWPSAHGPAELQLRSPRHLPVNANTIAFSADGKSLVVGTDEVVILRDIATPRNKRRIPHDPQLGPNSLVVISPDGKWLLTARVETDTTPRVWDVASGKRLHELPMDKHKIRYAAFTADGARVATAGLDQTVRLWDAKTGKLDQTLSGFKASSILGFAFAPRGNRLAAVVSPPSPFGDTAAPTLYLWDLDNPKRPPRSVVIPELVWTAFAPDGETLVWGCCGQTAGLMDFTSGKDRRPPLEGHQGAVRTLAYTPDGKRIATGSADHTLRLWDAATSRALWQSPILPGQVEAVVISPDSRRLFAAENSGSITCWNLQTHPPTLWRGPETPPQRRLPESDDKQLAKTLRDLGQHIHCKKVFSRDGKLLAFRLPDKVCLWSIADGKVVASYPQDPRDPAVDFTFAPDGQRLAVLFADRVYVRDLKSNQEIFRKKYPQQRVQMNVAFSPDGRMLAVTWASHTELIELLTGEQRGVLPNGGGLLAISPDCRFLANANAENTLHVYNLAANRTVAVFTARRLNFEINILHVAFAANSRRVATTSDDTTVLVWDLPGE